ncbi:cache domain-containing sensor histidine kinase [Cohnella silvisoli]|uniref:Sensor histidine kinase n=1 Tax=Cohnella silvisoli TaxID=2873699 RepID=A0ABV1L3Q9_9BACL|nr:sensor histidine kinase [Cohnella silvisoli]MCD9026196.1 sensor histidine kinase [Cohnella silvisoli]
MMRLFDFLKLHQKWMLAIFSLIVVPLVVYTYLSYTKMADLAKSQTIQLAEQTTQNTASELGFLTASSINALDFLSLDRSMNEMLSREPANNDIPLQLRDYANIVNFANTLQRNKDFYRIRLYVHDDFVYANDHINLFGMSQASREQWGNELIHSGQTAYWFVPGKGEQSGGTPPLVSVVRRMLNLDNFTLMIGISRIDILQSTLTDKLTRTKITDTGLVYLQNARGQIIARSDPERGSDGILDAKEWQSLPANEWNTRHIGNKSVMLSHRAIGKSDWMLVTVIPVNEVLAGITALRDQLIAILLSIVLIAYFLAYLTSKAGTKKIKYLIKRMKRVQSGDLNVIITRYGKDEIGELVENFNFMILKLTGLMNEHIQLGIELRSADLRTLQAQINPHFLYNSLDLINCTAIEHKVPDITTMVKALTKYYKLGLSKGMNIVSLESELEHVKAYVQIMNMRYTDAIKLAIEVDSPLLSCRIPKITLQPLVENAILHGILEKAEKRGTIRITGKQDRAAVYLYIEDDGVGMDAERLSTLLDYDHQDPNHSDNGFGVKNTHDRLRLAYGDSYGLGIKSEHGKGTSVEIRFPSDLDYEEE